MKLVLRYAMALILVSSPLTAQTTTADPLAVKLVKSYYQLEDVSKAIGLLLQKVGEDHAVSTRLNAAKAKVQVAQTLLKADIDELGNEPVLLLLSQRLVAASGVLVLNAQTIKSQLTAGGEMDDETTAELLKVSETAKAIQVALTPTPL